MMPDAVGILKGLRHRALHHVDAKRKTVLLLLVRARRLRKKPQASGTVMGLRRCALHRVDAKRKRDKRCSPGSPVEGPRRCTVKCEEGLQRHAVRRAL